MTRRLRLKEWVPKKDVHLSLAERDALQAAFPSTIVRAVAGSTELYDVVPGSHIGVAHFGTLDVEVRPKIEIDRLMFLLSYVMDPRHWRDTEYEFAEDDDVLEAIVPGFVRQVAHAVRRGLLHGYRTHHDTTTTVRGRIDIEAQLRRYGLPFPIEVVYDEFTSDILENQLLRAALHRLRTMRLRSIAIQRAVQLAERLLASVPLRHFGHTVPTVQFTRLNEHYRPAIALARLILSGSSFEMPRHEDSPYGSTVSTSGFVVNMFRVFEDFVVAALGEELRRHDLSLVHGDRSRVRLWLDDARDLPLKPDLSLWSGRTCTFIGDVKYKRLSVEGMPNADVYQTLAYMTAAGLRRALLIYAKGEANNGAHTLQDPLTGVERVIEVVALDLATDPEDLLAQVRSLADRALAMQAGYMVAA